MEHMKLESNNATTAHANVPNVQLWNLKMGMENHIVLKIVALIIERILLNAHALKATMIHCHLFYMIKHLIITVHNVLANANLVLNSA
jgi:hypothetical protein